MAKYGWNFRQTAGFVTDGTDDTYVLVDFIGEIADDDTSGRNGITTDWNTFTSFDGLVGRDRLNTLNPKLAGHNRCSNAGQEVFRINLTGSYYVRLAAGDNDSDQTIRVIVRDNATNFITIARDVTFNNWVDATDTVRTSETDWVNNNAQAGPFTFNGYVEIVIGDNTAAGNTTLCHFELEEAGGGGGGGGGPTIFKLVGGGLVGNPSISV